MNKRLREIHFKIRRELFPYISKLRFEIKLLPTLLIKKSARFQYSAIVIGHNSENYVDQLMKSFVNQSLDFTNNISIIFIDDGSTDNTAHKVKKWSKKYPNISYFFQEKRGLSTARNLGLEQVKSPWVTFINSDDFISTDYFLSVDQLLSNKKYFHASLVSCYGVIYNEKLKKYKRFVDTHHLKLNFRNGVDLKEVYEDVALSEVNSSFFKTEIIKNHHLKFNEKLKYSFADAHFIGRYLNFTNGGKVLLNPLSTYFFRESKKSRSQLDSMWSDPDKYDLEMSEGHLDLAGFYQKSGAIPVNIQKTLFLDIASYFFTLLKNPEYLDSLDESRRESFEMKLVKIFSFIDVDTLENFKLVDLSPHYLEGILGRFKNHSINSFNVKVEYYDDIKNSVKLSYYSYFDKVDSFKVNTKDRGPLFIKQMTTSFNGKTLFQENFIWLKLTRGEELSCFINESQVTLNLGDENFLSLSYDNIQRHFRKLEIPKNKSIYRNAWLFMDRDTQADDNAEHLYRYIVNNHPSVPAFFVLRKSSHDWARLEKEGFRLIDMCSRNYKIAYRDCEKLISSHIDPYVVKFLGKNSLNGKQFIFLQHGVTMNNVSRWLNKKRIDCFVTSTYKEYSAIASNESSSFNIGEKEVLLSGFPRHDRIINLASNSSSEKTILIMPTWRMYLSGENIKNSNERRYNKDFMNSFYAKSWQSLLNSPLLEELVNRYNYKVIFFPHANTQMYLKDFRVPDFIQTLSHAQGSIQDLFIKAQMMITDYSSVAFEMGIQKKEVIYYQFDEEEFFSGIHLYKKGYFDYRRDGFGPVCKTEDEVLSALGNFFKNDGNIGEEYLKRVEKTFAFFDDKSCERVFNHLVSMSHPEPRMFSLEIALKRAAWAQKRNYLSLADERFKEIGIHYPSCDEERDDLKPNELRE